MLKWLHATFEFPRIDLCTHFLMACSNHHFKMAEWLYKTFKLEHDGIYQAAGYMIKNDTSVDDWIKKMAA